MSGFIELIVTTLLNGLGSILTVAAPIAGVALAVWGAVVGFRRGKHKFHAWRRGVRSSKQLEAARELLQATIVVRDAFRDTRIPHDGDLPGGGHPTTRPGKDEAVSPRDAYKVRMNKLTAAVQRLVDAETGAEVFGKEEVPKLVNEIYKLVNRLTDTAHAFWQAETSKSHDPGVPGGRGELNQDDGEMRHVVFSGREEDVLDQELTKAVDAIRTWCEAHST